MQAGTASQRITRVHFVLCNYAPKRKIAQAGKNNIYPTSLPGARSLLSVANSSNSSPLYQARISTTDNQPPINSPYSPHRNTSMVLMAISDIVSYHLHCAGMMKIHRNQVSRIEQLSAETVQPENEVGVHRQQWWWFCLGMTRCF